MSETITVTISKELREKIDLTRGDIPRSKFISRSLEAFFKNRAITKKVIRSNLITADEMIGAQCIDSCRRCIGCHRNIKRSTIYCKCQCHKKTTLALESIGGPVANAKRNESFQGSLK